MQGLDIIFGILILIMSVVIHEVSHGYAAFMLGDRTAEYEGRLTLNPLKHLELFGSIILPLLLVLSHSPFVLGWAKPVPFNPYNLRNQRWGEAIVAVAGPISNFAIAIVFGLIIQFGATVLPEAALSLMVSIVFINVLLAFFNLVPIPPLDGSKILFSFLPLHLRHLRTTYERVSLVFLIVFILFLWKYFLPLIDFVAKFLIGIH